MRRACVLCGHAPHGTLCTASRKPSESPGKSVWAMLSIRMKSFPRARRARGSTPRIIAVGRVVVVFAGDKWRDATVFRRLSVGALKPQLQLPLPHADLLAVAAGLPRARPDAVLQLEDGLVAQLPALEPKPRQVEPRRVVRAVPLRGRSLRQGGVC